MPVIELHALRKVVRGRRRPIVAVDALDLEVPEGGVFGFLGPNGSGKTTTIRCLLGLARPTGGACRLLGADVATELARVLDRVGALVEAPGVNPGLSGEQTLRVHATAVGVGRRRVEEVLEQVGLADRAGDAARGYSLGMRQRLGVAIALLKDPEVLVLDEPANGLDPAGIRDMRRLVRRLADEGRTVFVSSHQLAEVEQVCDRVAIVARGRLVVAGTVAEVLAGAGGRALVVKVADLARGAEVLRRAGFEVERRDDRLRVVGADRDGADVARILGGCGVWPSELGPEASNLEAAFLALTEDAA